VVSGIWGVLEVFDFGLTSNGDLNFHQLGASVIQVLRRTQKGQGHAIVVERMVNDPEMGSSNPLALTTRGSRSCIDLHRNRFALNAENLSRLA
jgi:hypothetical protein